MSALFAYLVVWVNLVNLKNADKQNLFRTLVFSHRTLDCHVEKSFEEVPFFGNELFTPSFRNKITDVLKEQKYPGIDIYKRPI